MEDTAGLVWDGLDGMDGMDGMGWDRTRTMTD